MKKLELLTRKGFVRVLKLLLSHLWACIFLCVFSLVMGLVSLSVWLFKESKRIVNTYPKTVLLIVCIILVVDHLALTVYFRTNEMKQNIRFDSLAAMKDSIQSVSLYDSGYAKGLVDGNQMLKIQTDGIEQKESDIHRP